jgi:hypothetical protein
MLINPGAQNFTIFLLKYSSLIKDCRPNRKKISKAYFASLTIREPILLIPPSPADGAKRGCC